MDTLLKYVINIIIKRTVGEAKKKWKDLLAKAWIEAVLEHRNNIPQKGSFSYRSHYN